MSNVIDERVVEMRFDNGQFEQGVQTSLSTLDRLKKALKLDGITKGFDKLNTSSAKIEMNGVGEAVDNVSHKFSALQIMGATALANITNSAVNAGKRIVSALTIDPIKSGFEEYETQINAVQTILANTSDKGTTLDQVNEALDTLNTYADKTIYNFTEMTRNIGTFTAAGVDLDTSVSAIQGVANVAAISGSTSQQASTAMYQLSQALAAGAVKLQDWNSVVNAGMGGQVFQNALIKTSELLGTGAEAAIKAQGSFRESLSEGWITAEVLTKTLNKFTTSGANEYVAEYTGLSVKAVEAALAHAKAEHGEAEAIEYAAKALAKKSGKSKAEIKSTLEMAKTAEDAATKVKTFSQLIDTLKEAVQSGWTQTWEILIGDFGEAKELFTGISDFLGDIINKTSDARNNLLEKSFGQNPYSKFLKNLTDTKKGIKDINEDAKKYSKTLDDGYGKTVSKLVEMSNAQLKAEGYTKKQIHSLRALQKEAEKVGIPIEEFVNRIDELNGRTLVIESFKNIVSGLAPIFKAVGDAFATVFKPLKAKSIYDFIAAFHRLTTHLQVSSETAEKVKTIFTALFHVLSFKFKFTKLKLGFKILSLVLGNFGLTTLDVAAKIASFANVCLDWYKNSGFMAKAATIVANALKSAGAAIKGWVDNVSKLSGVQKFIGAIKTAFDGIKKVMDDLSSIKNVGISHILDALRQIADLARSGLKNAFTGLFDGSAQDILAGLANGLVSGAHAVFEAIANIARTIYDTFCAVLGIHSPSTEFEAAGEYTMIGYENGLKSKLGDILDFFKNLVSKIIETVKGIGLGKFVSLVGLIKTLITIKKLVNSFKAISSPFEGLGDVLESASKAIKKFGKVLGAMAMNLKAKALLKIAASIAILAAAIAALVYVGGDDPKKLWNAVAVIGALSAVLAVLAIAVDKLSAASASIGKNGVQINGLKSSLMGIGAALLMLALVVKIMGGMDPEKAKDGFIRLGGMILALSAFIVAYAGMAKLVGENAKYSDKLGKMLTKVSIALLILVGVAKLAAGLKPEDMARAGEFAAGFSVFMLALSAASRIGRDSINKLGSMALKISVAMGLMIGVIKLAATINPFEAQRAAIFAAGFATFVLALGVISRISGNVTKLGGTLLAISTSMGIMVSVIKLMGGIDPGVLFQGSAVLVGLSALIVVFIKMLDSCSKDIPKMAGTLLALSFSIGILAGVTALMGMLSVTDVAQGLTVVGALSLFMKMMIEATRGASDCKGSITAMAIVIGILAISVAALSLIDPLDLVGPTVAMSLLMGMFALIEKAGSNIQSSVGTIAVMAVVVAGLAGIVYLLSGLPVTNVLGTSVGLSALMLSLSASMRIISASSSAVMSALPAVGIMLAVLAAVSLVVGALQKFDLAPSLESAAAISLLLVAMTGVYVALGLTGGLAGTAMAGAVGMMGVIATIGAVAMAIGGLMSLIPNDQIEAWKQGFTNFMDFITILTRGLGEAVGAFAEGVLSGLSSGVASFGESLKTLAASFGPFVDAAKKIDASAVAGVDNLVAMVLKITGTSLLDGIKQFLTGSSSMEDFAQQLLVFGNAITAFSTLVAGKIDSNAIAAATNAGMIIAALQDAIPEDKWLDGKISIDKFGEKIVAFGRSMVNFSSTVAGIDAGAISTSISVCNDLITLMGSFGQVDTSKLEKFKIATLGNQLKAYASSVSSINAGAISSSISATRQLMDLLKDMSSIKADVANSFNKAISNLARTNIQGFVNAFQSSGSKFFKTGSDMIDQFTKGAKSKEGNLKTICTALATSMNAVFASKASQFNATGAMLMTNFANGLNSRTGAAKTAISSCLSGALSTASGYYSLFYNAGARIADGLANGISANSYKAAAKAKAMANAAATAAKAALDIHSPSRVFDKIGQNSGLGFVNALGRFAEKAYAAGARMANFAKEGIQEAAIKMDGIFDSNSITEPTIRPIMDLSNVNRGINAINSMFGDRNLGSVRSVSNMMSHRNNTSNADVVTAINHLRRDINNMDSGTTYNVNGVNVDNSGGVADAVRTLTHAAIIERRI